MLISTSCVLQVATGKLLKHWRAHLRAITCLVFSDDDSIVVSGAENGDVRVWSLYEYGVLQLSC